MAFDFQNFFSTSLTSDITSSAIVIPLDDVPTISEGTLVIDPDGSNPEIIYFTSKTATTVNMVSAGAGRGYDGSTAATHTAGTTVIMAPIKNWFSRMASLAGTNAWTAGNTWSGTAAFGGGTDVIGGWTSWTPTLTNITLGNGNMVAKYLRIGKTVWFKIIFTLGTTSSFAVGTDAYITYPAAPIAADYTQYGTLGTITMFDISTGDIIQGTVAAGDTNGRMILLSNNASGTYVKANGVNSVTPFTWTSTDRLVVSGVVEIA